MRARIDHRTGVVGTGRIEELRRPFRRIRLEMLGGELGRRVHREGRNRRHALLLIVGEPGHWSIGKGQVTAWKIGRSVENGHDGKRGVVGNTGDFVGDGRSRHAAALQEIEGLRSRRSEYGCVGCSNGNISCKRRYTGPRDLEAVHGDGGQDAKPFTEGFWDPTHPVHARVPNLDPAFGMCDASCAEPDPSRPALDETAHLASELLSTHADVLCTVIECRCTDPPSRHAASDRPSFVDERRIDSLGNKRTTGREPRHAGSDDQNGSSHAQRA